MKRLDRVNLLAALLILVLAALFFRPPASTPPPPVVVKATSAPSPHPPVAMPTLPSLDGGRGGIGVQVNVLEGTYDYVVDPPPKTPGPAVGVGKDKQKGPTLHLRLAP